MVRARRKGRCSRRIESFLLSLLLFLSSTAGHCAGLFYNVSGAEGLIGAISGNFTLWDLATTVLGAAGFMIVNEDIQQTASTHLGGNQYTLDYLVQEGLIEVNEQPSYSWDWSGLESLMSDWQNYKDSNMMYKINQAAAAYSPDLNDLWIDVFKQFVEVGKIGVDKIGSGITATVQDLSNIIGNAFADNVSVGMPIDLPATNGVTSFNSCYELTQRNEIRFLSYDPHYIKVVAKPWIGPQFLEFYALNRDTSDRHVIRIDYNDNSSATFNVSAGGRYQIDTQDIGDVVLRSNVELISGNANLNDYLDAWKNTSGDIIIESPDILTPGGAAVAPAVGTWAPNPYLGGVDWPDAWLQPVPAGAWSPAIDDLIDAPALPAPGEAGDIWGGVFDPYITNDPAIDIPGDDVIPTVAPRPTTAAGEGTWEEPYAVVPANPIPSMEDGAGQLPNIGEFFPFCIPGDFVYITKLLWSEDNVRTAPHIYLPLRIPSINFSYDIDIDFTPFEESAELLRTLVLISFCIALAILTKNLIWS